MKQAKRIVAMVLCLLALLALPAGAVMEKGEPNITAQTTMKEVRNNPGIKNSGFYTYSQDKDCPPGQALWEMTTVEGYTNEYVAEGCAKGLNLVIENYNNGVQVTHSIYTDAEKAEDRTKNNTGLFYFPAKAENARFALILAGSGANESVISQALRMKKIPADVIAEGLEEIDEREYVEILSGLIEQKRSRVKACTEYERNGKLIRFAVGRGFEIEAVCRCVKQTGEDDVYLD